MPADQILSLIGYRGSGKTTVARRLAELLDWQWVDADTEIERRAGCSIAEIFSQFDESYFRELEAQVTSELCRRKDVVVAWGGGVVLRSDNRKAITSSGRVVYLTASPAALYARMQSDKATADRRPALTGSGGLEEVTNLLAAREPLYRECATWTISTESHGQDRLPADIAQDIADLLPTGGEKRETEDSAERH